MKRGGEETKRRGEEAKGGGEETEGRGESGREKAGKKGDTSAKREAAGGRV